MDHTKKFVLVPEERIQNFVHQQLSELDNQMQNILSRKDLTENEKVTLYLQVLQKYVNFHFPQSKTLEENTDHLEEEKRNKNVEDEVNYENIMKNIEKEITDAAPKQYKAEAAKIINFIKKNKNIIAWSPRKEIIIKGKLISDTNIVNLINYLLRNRKTTPRAEKDFYDVLTQNGLPRNLVKNKYVKLSEKKMYAKPTVWTSY